MKSYKPEEKRFIESAILSNTASLILRNNFSDSKNYVDLVKISIEIAQEQLKQRNELFGTKEKIVKIKNEVPNVDFEEIITIFNQICIDLPKVTKCTTEREKAILKILEIYTLEDIGIVFNIIPKCDSLCGRTTMKWKADFDWVLDPKNFIRILENKYQNVNGNNEQSNSDLFKSAINSQTAKDFRFV